MLRRIVALLGVGGVGKTTFAYKILGLSERPVITLRPSYYRLYIGDLEIDVLDVPGQRVFEIALKLASFRMSLLDRLIYMYDVTNSESLYSILDLHSIFIERGKVAAEEIVIVGNKMDLANEIGFFVEADDVAHAVGAVETYYISALRDGPEILLKVLLGPKAQLP